MTLVATEEATGEGQEPLCGRRQGHVSRGSSRRGQEDGDGG
jgi:hypothetical protein